MSREIKQVQQQPIQTSEILENVTSLEIASTKNDVKQVRKVTITVIKMK